MMDSMDCPVEDVLGAFVSGGLEPAVMDELERHIADCSRCAAVVAMAASDAAEPWSEGPIEAGGRIDRYHILGVAGKGAVGYVYAAYDPKLDRKIALKVLRHSDPDL